MSWLERRREITADGGEPAAEHSTDVKAAAHAAKVEATKALGGRARAAKEQARAIKEDVAESKRQLKAVQLAERELRGEFFELAERFTPYVAVESNGALYVVSTHDSHIGRDLFAKRGRKEMRTLDRALAAQDQLLPRGTRSVFIDAGANIGTTVIDAVVAHGFASAFAFEPEPENLRLLRLNLQLNGLEDRVTASEVGLSDHEGSAVLDTTTPGSGQHWVVEPGAEAGDSIVTIHLTSIDALVDAGELDPDAVSFLWMDVEGHEAHVLAGASALLERGVPLVMEFCPRLFRRAGRLDELEEIMRTRYSHLLDLRKPWPDGVAPFVPTTDIGEIVAEYGDTGFTDVVACRVP